MFNNNIEFLTLSDIKYMSYTVHMRTHMVCVYRILSYAYVRMYVCVRTRIYTHTHVYVRVRDTYLSERKKCRNHPLFGHFAEIAEIRHFCICSLWKMPVFWSTWTLLWKIPRATSVLTPCVFPRFFIPWKSGENILGKMGETCFSVEVLYTSKYRTYTHTM